MADKLSRRDLALKLWDAWEACNENREVFDEYAGDEALALQNLLWLFRHERTRQYLSRALKEIDPVENRIAYGCISRIRDLFILDININDGGDKDDLWDFVNTSRSLLAEARADLLRSGKFDLGVSFTPLEVYLTDLETGAFGFFPLKDGGVCDEIASWQR